MTGFIVIDVETRSLADLKKTGAARYAADPSTDIWCIAYAVDDTPVALWRPGEPAPGVVFVAHNAGFERAIWQRGNFLYFGCISGSGNFYSTPP
jgi:DNA polymerase